MNKFRKKPIVIEAEQATELSIIRTLEGDMTVNVGDWIVTGIKGERYPVKPDVFEATYEPAPEAVSISDVRKLEFIRAEPIRRPAMKPDDAKLIADYVDSCMRGQPDRELFARIGRRFEQAALVPGLVSVLEKCYRELNEIRARDGVPYTFQGIQASVDEEYFSSIVDDCYKLIAEARRVMEADNG